MVCTANDLLEWKDFPKGLRVLLLDQDIHSSTLITSKLQEMDYIVVSVFSEHEALSTIERKNESFHVAIIEISAQNSDERYKFLETAKDLPTIMISKDNCLRTMMKCIALGAVEFLIKPLSEDKLRNIWQHVVHKAFSTSERENSESLKSVKEFVGSVLKLQQFSNSTQEESPKEPDDDDDEDDIMMDEDEFEQLAFADKFPAPSTPQIKQGGRSVDDGDYHDQNNCSPPKESEEVEPETKFVDTTCENSYANMEEDLPQVETVKEEDPSTDGSKGSDDSPPNPNDKDDDTTLRDFMDNLHKESAPQKSSRPKSNKKKMKVDWTPDLHKKFVQAVEQLGVDQAIPSRILELMKVDGLTRHNVASHLQKYRMNRRHILPKEDERRWPRPRDTMQRNYYTQRPVMAYPPYQTNHTYAPQPQVYPVWGHHQGGRPPGLPMWAPPPTYPWQPPESWHWKPYPAMSADAWGCPVMQPPHPGPPVSYPQVQATGPTYRFQSPDTYGKQSVDTHPGEEIIDRVVKEAISKPWLPLPIGLKPPSTDGVLAELSRQGISTVPPHQINNGRHEHC